jgi:antitoxin component of MazEF toxin-antitoxin module
MRVVMGTEPEGRVDVREEGSRIVVEPLQPTRYDIDDLIAGITETNRHDPVDLDQPVGREVW